MAMASHIIFSAYGFWLPNDPRGSWSDFVRKWELLRFGEATKWKINSPRSVASVPHDRKLRKAAKAVLDYRPVSFTGEQALVVSQGFRTAIDEGSYTIYACAILPEHVHMVVARHRRKPTQIMGHMKAKATRALRRHECWFSDDRPVWVDRGWKVYLDTPADVRRAIAYVEQNPIKEGKPLQRWSFVSAFAFGSRMPPLRG
jgi:REP element-mobilizing transposase RayT